MSHAVSRRTLMGGAACGAALATLPAPLFGADPRTALDPRTAFPLIVKAIPAAVLIDADADSAVRHVATNFAKDLERVSGAAARLIDGASGVVQGPVVIIGVLGHSAVIDRLIAAGKIAAADLRGEWEAFRQIVVDDPMPGVSRALVIVGSDRRGAVFGTYDVSERIGVSPWHWFASATC
jgi:hypothetical protein